MGYKQEEAAKFAGFIKGLGFRAFLAKTGEYGFITNAEGSRVVCFSMNDGGTLSGNYGPPSGESGTGWRMDKAPHDLRTAEDVQAVLYAYPPQWAGKGWEHMTTLDQHLKMYGSSSGYSEV